MSTVPDLVHVEAFNLLCADQIGYGMSRQVFSSRLLPDCVVKIEQVIGHFGGLFCAHATRERIPKAV